MIIVSDASPLIQLADAGCLNVLQEIFDEIVIPPEVEREVFHEGRRRAKPGWIKVKTFEKAATLQVWSKIRQAVDIGEAAAIALAIEHELNIIIDDKAGIGQCQRYSVKHLSLYGVLRDSLPEKRFNQIMKTVREETGTMLCEPGP